MPHFTAFFDIVSTPSNRFELKPRMPIRQPPTWRVGNRNIWLSTAVSRNSFSAPNGVDGIHQMHQDWNSMNSSNSSNSWNLCFLSTQLPGWLHPDCALTLRAAVVEQLSKRYLTIRPFHPLIPEKFWNQDWDSRNFMPKMSLLLLLDPQLWNSTWLQNVANLFHVKT